MKQLRERVKKFLVKHPHLYGLIQSIRSGLPISEVKKGLDSLNHPHRPILIEKISSFHPNSILEIGCGYGPNLYWLAGKIPCARIRGIDINPEEVEKGDKFLSDIMISVGKAEELGHFENNSIDVVFTDAVLMYVNKDDIRDVIKNMLRISKKAIILVEWHKEGPDTYNSHIGNWTRDYKKLLEEFVPWGQIKITKITKEMWPNRHWIKLGYIFEVKL